MEMINSKWQTIQTFVNSSEERQKVDIFKKRLDTTHYNLATCILAKYGLIAKHGLWFYKIYVTELLYWPISILE